MNIRKWLINWKSLVGILAVAVAATVWFSLRTGTPRLALFWLFGLAFGVIVQRSRFCFVSAISNFTLFRDGRLLKGILGGLFISTIGFAIIMFREVPDPTSGIPATAYIAPFGWHLVLAGVIFGVGMVLAGGCLMGTLYRISEGAIASLVALLGIIIGMGILQHNWPIWDKYISNLSYGGKSGVWMPQYIGWIASIVLTLSVIAILYWLVLHMGGSVKNKTKTTSQPLSAHLASMSKSIFKNGWPLALGGVLFGAFNIWMYAVVERPCGLAGEVMRWTQIVMDAAHIPAAPLGTIPGS